MDRRQTSGKRRGAGRPRLLQVGGISHRPRERLIRGFPLRFLNHGGDGRAHRPVAHDLAEGAERSQVRRGVQVGSTRVRNLANPGYFGMVVEDFSRKEVNFAGEQHAHDQGMRPILEPVFSSLSQPNRRAPSGFRLKLPRNLCQL